jgi:hypothetical protein
VSQLAQVGQDRARAPECPPALTSGPHLSSCLARSLSPLSSSRCPVGQSCRRRSSRTRVRSLSLSVSHEPHLSVCPQPPAHVPRLGRAHDRAFSSHLRMSSPLLSPAPRSPTSLRSLVPSAEPPRLLSHPTHATRQALPPLTKDSRRSATVVESPLRPWPR